MLGQLSTSYDFVRYSPFGVTSTTTNMIFAIMVSPCVWDELVVHHFLQHQGANLAFVCTAKGQYYCLVHSIPPIKRTPAIFSPYIVENLQPLSPVPGGGGFFRSNGVRRCHVDLRSNHDNIEICSASHSEVSLVECPLIPGARCGTPHRYLM